MPKFEENEPLKRKRAKEIGTIIAVSLGEYKQIIQDEFTEKGIKAQFHQGEKGTFGVSYIDLVRKAVYNGNDLGKDYGWYAYKDRFGNQVGRIEAPANTISERPLAADSKSGVTLSWEQLEQTNSKLATIFSNLKSIPSKVPFWKARSSTNSTG